MALSPPRLPFGLPGEAWQPLTGGGMPGEYYLGPNSLPAPQFPAQWDVPALNPGQPIAGQLGAGQGGQAVAALNPAPQARPMPAAPSPAPNMFGSRAGQRVGTGNVPGMQNLTPRPAPQPFPDAARSAVRGGPQSIRPTPAMQGAGQVGGKLSRGMPSAGPMSGYGGRPGMGASGVMNAPLAPTGAPPPPMSAAGSATSATSSATPSALPSIRERLFGMSAKPDAKGLSRFARSGTGQSLGRFGLGLAADWGADQIMAGRELDTAENRILNATLRGGTYGIGAPFMSAPVGAGIGATGLGAMQANRELSMNADEDAKGLARYGLGSAALQSIPVIGPAIQASEIGGKLNELTGWFGTPEGGNENVIDDTLLGNILGGADQSGEVSEQEATLGSQVGQVMPRTPDEFAPFLQRAGLSEEGTRQAITEYNAMIEQNRVYAELGLIEVPDIDEEGNPVLDEEGNALTRRLTPAEADDYSASMFAQSIPEVLASDDARIQAQIRAAAYRDMVQQQMGPTLDLQRQLGDLYTQKTANLGLSPEMQQAMGARGALFDLAQTGEADAMGLYMQQLPEILAAQSAMDQQAALQAQIANAEQQLILQQMRPDLFAPEQAAVDPFAADIIASS